MRRCLCDGFSCECASPRIQEAISKEVHNPDEATTRAEEVIGVYYGFLDVL